MYPMLLSNWIDTMHLLSIIVFLLVLGIRKNLDIQPHIPKHHGHQPTLDMNSYINYDQEWPTEDDQNLCVTIDYQLRI